MARIQLFDTWAPGYGQATVLVLLAGTSTPAAIFSDENLSVTADNPQTLSERIIGGISYGKFAASVYVGAPYQLQINTIDVTGVERPPLVTLEGADASLATVQAAGGTVDVTLAAHTARRIDVRDYGGFLAVGESGASAATNNATLVAAIGAASAIGAGFVEAPGGTYAFTALTLPAGVVVRGAGRGATVLQSTTAGNVVTIGGARAGLSRLTLDGVTLVAGSVGIKAVDKDQIVLDDVEVKRFADGIFRNGGNECDWRDLFVSNCTHGYKGHSTDTALRFNRWTGGRVELCSSVGIWLKNDGEACAEHTFIGVGFDTNTGTAVQLEGARDIVFQDGWWSGNTGNLFVLDATPTDADNTVINVEIVGGSMEGGTISIGGNAETIAFRNMPLANIAVTLTLPGHNILVENCRESGITISGIATAWTRRRTGDNGTTTGLTTGNAATKAWAIALDSGQIAILAARVIGRQRNAIAVGFYYLVSTVLRQGATLAYDTQTGNFTAGNTLTGATSGATARIRSDSDSGATGTLTLIDVVGTFADNEIITDGAGGSATVNGVITEGATSVVTTTQVITPQETDAAWGAAFVANGPEIELQVTGNTGDTVEWTVAVDVIST